MFADIEYPKIILPKELDSYLSRGWFRMRQTIFTTNFLIFDQQFYAAIWLRVTLKGFIHDKKYNTLKKLNKGFRTEIKKAQIEKISKAHEQLYLHYRQSVAFDVSPSLQELFIGIEAYNRFNTHEVNIYDGDNLIAAGFFDLGEKSAAGISCIYHPAYKKYSLGKYLMYLKMDYCIQHQLDYFYPGYVVPGYGPFDYKLDVGRASLEYLQLATQRWIAYNPAEPLINPVEQMVEKLTGLQCQLVENKIPNKLLFYRFFEANLHPYYYGFDLFDFPVFIQCFPAEGESVYTLVVFDIRTAQYHLYECGIVINIGAEPGNSNIFDNDILKVKKSLFATANAAEMSAWLSAIPALK